MKQFLVLVCMLFIYSCGIKKLNQQSAQLIKSDISYIDSLIEISPRNTVVFIHTEWCSYCKNMKHTTFRNKDIVNTLNNNFNFVSFDGESEKEIEFNGKLYRYKASGRTSGIHTLAEEIGTNNGVLNYPTLVILDSNYKTLFIQSSFMSTKELKLVLENFED